MLPSSNFANHTFLAVDATILALVGALIDFPGPTDRFFCSTNKARPREAHHPIRAFAGNSDEVENEPWVIGMA